jgi:putative endonuclease
VYILRCGDGTLYTGYTNNLEARLAAHRDGKGAKYTRGRGPLELVYQEALDNNIAAMQREREIQRLTRPAKERLISTHLPWKLV